MNDLPQELSDLLADAAPCYRVWAFHDAPKFLRDLSRHGGDEDWLVLCPSGFPEPSWADNNTAFGCCAVERHDLPGSLWYVLIGAHA